MSKDLHAMLARLRQIDSAIRAETARIGERRHAESRAESRASRLGFVVDWARLAKLEASRAELNAAIAAAVEPAP